MATATTLQAEMEDEKLIREKLAELQLPPGVQFRDLSLGDTWSGDLVWRINFAIDKNIPITDDFIRDLNKRHQKFRFALIDAGIHHFADTHLVDPA